MLLLEMHASPNVTSVKAKSPPIAKSCFTDQYFFTILGTNGAELWTLAKFSRSNPRQLFDDSLAGRFEVVYPLRTFAATWTISDVLKSGDFVVSAVRKGVNGCLEGDYSATVTRGKDSLVLDGTCIIDPSHHGLVIENRYTLSATNFYRTTMRRKINIIDDKIVCNTLSTESKDVAKGTIEFTDLYTFDKYTANTPDKVIFTLEHYGIPTPDDDLVPWYSRWKVWALLAVFGMMLAVLFRRLAVRRRVR